MDRDMQGLLLELEGTGAIALVQVPSPSSESILWLLEGAAQRAVGCQKAWSGQSHTVRSTVLPHKPFLGCPTGCCCWPQGHHPRSTSLGRILAGPIPHGRSWRCGRKAQSRVGLACACPASDGRTTTRQREFEVFVRVGRRGGKGDNACLGTGTRGFVSRIINRKEARGAGVEQKHVFRRLLCNCLPATTGCMPAPVVIPAWLPAPFLSCPLLSCLDRLDLLCCPSPPPSFTARQAGRQNANPAHAASQGRDPEGRWVLALTELGSAGWDWLGAANRAGLARWHWLALRPGPHTSTPFFFISQLRHSFSPTSYLTSSPPFSVSTSLSRLHTKHTTHHPPTPAPSTHPSASDQNDVKLLNKVPQQSVEPFLFMGSVFL